MKKVLFGLGMLLMCIAICSCAKSSNSKDSDDEEDEKAKSEKSIKALTKLIDDMDISSTDDVVSCVEDYLNICIDFYESDPSEDEVEDFKEEMNDFQREFGESVGKLDNDDLKKLEKDKSTEKKIEKLQKKLEKAIERYNKKHKKDVDDEELAEVEGVEDDYTYDYDADSLAMVEEYRSYEQPVTEPVSPSESKYDVACQRLLTEYDLQGMSKYELKIMRNWIFARHGYIFKTDDMKAFYGAQSWYTPLYNDVTPYLNQIELKNIDFIKRHE